MTTRHRRVALLLISTLLVVMATTAWASKTPRPTPRVPTPPPLSLDITPEVELGAKGVISGVGFTPNGKVKVIFHRPDNTTSEDIGKADGNGKFKGTFTVAPDRPIGQWTLSLIDLSSGQMVVKPFVVSSHVSASSTKKVLPPLTISRLFPTMADQGQTVELSILGEGFVDGAKVAFSPPTGITMTSVKFVSPRQIRANLTLATDSPTTSRNVTVTNHDGRSATVKGVFTVIALPPTFPTFSVSLLAVFAGFAVYLLLIKQKIVPRKITTPRVTVDLQLLRRKEQKGGVSMT